MAVLKIYLFLTLLVCSNSEETNSPKVVQQSTKQEARPTSIASRFFDFGGFINQLFPGFNQGNQGGLGPNPPGMDFPGNSQFYPTVPIQGQNPAGGSWPVIDDASRFPNQGNPMQGNSGGYPQYPNQGNYGGLPQNPTQFPNQGGMGGSYPNYPQYPPQYNQGNFGGTVNPQFPGQGNFGGSPSNQFPQNPNQGNAMDPRYPNQGNFGGVQSPSPQNPNNGGQMQNQFSNQGGAWNQNPNQNNFRPGTGQGGDGTLDGLVPPQGSWNAGMPNDFSPIGIDSINNMPANNNKPNLPDSQLPYPDDGQDMGSDPSGVTNAILGRPVLVPTSTTEPGRIIYPSSTESPARRQCVQDCQTTTEYNPVCGSDNITYINPGKFVCARNCGIDVFVLQRGRCPDDTPYPRNVITLRPQ